MWLTHLEFDATNPFMRHWFDAMGERGPYVRCDARGVACPSLLRRRSASIAGWMTSAVAASVSDDPVNVLGFSQGATVAIGFAVRRPGRVARLILHGASRLFAVHGPAAVTVRQIATAAGVSPALVVHHFGSKEGLREGSPSTCWTRSSVSAST
jgi:pimeloyl-ACP methyl ester carboxylesterase